MTTLLCPDHIQYEDGSICYLKAPDDHPSLIDEYPLYEAIQRVLENPEFRDARILMIDHVNQDFIWRFDDRAGRPKFENHKTAPNYYLFHQGMLCRDRYYTIQKNGMTALRVFHEARNERSKRKGWLFPINGPDHFNVNYKAGKLTFLRKDIGSNARKTHIRSIRLNEPISHAYAIDDTVFIVTPTCIRMFEAVFGNATNTEYVTRINERKPVIVGSSPVTIAENSIMYSDGSVWDLSLDGVTCIFGKSRKSASN